MHSTEQYWASAILLPFLLIGLCLIGLCFISHRNKKSRPCCASFASPEYKVGEKVVVTTLDLEAVVIDYKSEYNTKTYNYASYELQLPGGTMWCAPQKLRRGTVESNRPRVHPRIDGDGDAAARGGNHGGKQTKYKVGDEVVVNDPGHDCNGKKAVVTNYTAEYDTRVYDYAAYSLKFADGAVRFLAPQKLQHCTAESRVHPAVERISPPPGVATSVNATNSDGNEAARGDAISKGAAEMTFPDSSGTPDPATAPASPVDPIRFKPAAVPDSVSAPSPSVNVAADAPRDVHGENEAAAQIPVVAAQIPVVVAEPEPTVVVSSAECVVVVPVSVESDPRLSKFCGNCGTQRRGNNKFCVNCGSDLSL